MKKKTIYFLRIALLFAGIFLLYNIFWIAWRYLKYKEYISGFSEFSRYSSYVLNPNDGFLYNVKEPDYLSYTGNLGISTDNNRVALIIWPKVFNGYNIGTQIIVDDITYCIMLSPELTAKDPYYQNIVDDNINTILELQKKAEIKWGIDI